MPGPDLILVHPPSVFSFRELPIFFGPISDVVPSSSIFEIYPIGFLTISEYLYRHGIETRIVNLAQKMLRSSSFEPREFLKRLKPVAFGIDLHWLPHADGSLSLAELLKKLHPRTPVILGGLSATYYREEIMRDYPFVDFIVCGDSAEEPVRRLMEAIRQDSGYESVPNLAWRERNGAARFNNVSWRPESLDYVNFDYRHLFRMSVKHRDPSGYVPFKYWLRYPVTAVFSCRGCYHNCGSCGGSLSAFAKVCSRDVPCFRSPEVLAEDIGNIAALTSAPVMVIGDLMQAGRSYAQRFLDAMKKYPLKNEIALEFFNPPSEKLIGEIARSIEHFNVEMSPESHDPAIRAAFGKRYGNSEMEDAIGGLLAAGCGRVDLFFMVGLPYQDRSSVMESVDYCECLLRRFGKRLLPMISPLAPFIDPGSRIFQEPERFGCTLFCRTLKEHREAMLKPSWKHSLNYETRWMSRDEIAMATYEAARRLIGIKERFGILENRKARDLRRNIDMSIELLKKIDGKTGIDGALKADILRMNSANSLCDKHELDWPVNRSFAKLRAVVKLLLKTF
jgi:B12-binding domain/radical SAM domain protein